MKPTNITVSRSKHEATVTWDDGHVSTYPFSLLRAACPCASCRGGHENMGPTPDPLVFSLPIIVSPASTLRDIQPVGAYAISLVWEDGHDGGLYTWAYLRALCPCEQCRPPIGG